MKTDNRAWLWITVVILLILDIILLFRAKTSATHLTKCEEVIALCENLSEKLTVYETAFKTVIRNDNFSAKDTIIGVSAAEEIRLSNIFGGGEEYMVVCRFKEMQCNECVINAVAGLLNTKYSDLLNHTVFWANYNSLGALNFQKFALNISSRRVYNVSEFDLPIEKRDRPYYFVIDNHLKISDVFVPDINFPEITEAYFEHVWKRYYRK